MTSVEPLAIDIIVNAGSSIGALAEVRQGVVAVGAATTETAAQTVASADRMIASYNAAAMAARRVGVAAAASGAEAAAGLSRMERAAAGAAATFKALAGGLLGALAIGGGIELVKGFVEAASEEARSIRLVKFAFGEAGEEVLKFSETAATSLGLPAAKANELAAELGNYFRGVGIVGQKAAEQATELVKREVDIATATGKTVDEVQSIVEASLRGRGAGALAIGVKITPTLLSNEALREGLIPNLSTPLDANTKASAALSLLMKGTEPDIGAFGKTLGSVGTQTKILKASMEDFAAKLGSAVKPTIAAIGGVLVETVVPALHLLGNVLGPVLGAFGHLPPAVSHLIGVLGLLLLLRGPLTSLFVNVTARLIEGVVSLAGYATATGRAEKESAKLAAAELAAGKAAQQAAIAKLEAAAAAEALAAADKAAAAAAALLGESTVVAGAAVRTTAASIGAMAGPIGWVILGITAFIGVMGLLSSSEKETAPEVKNFTDLINEQTGALKANAAAGIAKLYADDVAAYTALGGGAGEWTRAIMGNDAALGQVGAHLVATGTVAAASSRSWELMSGAAGKLGLTVGDVTKILVTGTQAQKDHLKAQLEGTSQSLQDRQALAADLEGVARTLTPQTDLYGKVTAGAKDLSDQQKATADTAKEVAGATELLSKQLLSIPDAVTLAAAALDKLAGRAPDLEKALAAESAAAAATLADFGVGTTKTGPGGVTVSAQTKVDPRVVMPSGEIDTSDPAIGGKLYADVLTQRDSILAAAIAAADRVLSTGGSIPAALDAAKEQASRGIATFTSVESQVLGSRSAALRLESAYGLTVSGIVAAVQQGIVEAQKRQAAGDVAGGDNTTGEPAGFARGGSVWGGVPGVDSVHILAQQGEFVSNRAAAAAHRSELQAWNAQGYAGGGGVTQSGPDRWGGRTVTIAPGGIQISIDASGASPAEAALYASQAFRRSLEQAILDDVDRSL